MEETGICDQCLTEPCVCNTNQNREGEEPAYRGKRRRPAAWRDVTAWCPLCWYKDSSTFHSAITEDGARQHFQRLHQAQRPNCHETLKVLLGKERS